jgi:hypothetical protein
MKTKTKQKINKQKEFIEKSFSKIVKTTKDCIKNGKIVFNTLAILKKDYSVEFMNICDKGVKEIREDILPNFNMLCYIYVVESIATNVHTGKKRKIVSIGVCKSDFYKSIDIEFRDNKIVSEVTLSRKDKTIDVLDLWGKFEVDENGKCRV